MTGSGPRLIAHYLPQFHPIPENDAWWGKGFTEWTNTAKATPLFRNHYQPHVPADLGFYDLRVPESREAQAHLAMEYGIEAFCYYHYWFAGRRIIERPFNEVLKSGRPEFPFCLCWANQTWSGIWHGNPDKILIEQTYPGRDDYRAHFEVLLAAFRDPRYVTVDGKPLFLVFRPQQIPDVRMFTSYWRELAAQAGLKGLHLVGVQNNATEWRPQDDGFDAMSTTGFPGPGPKAFKPAPIKWLIRRLRKSTGKPQIYFYKDVIEHLRPKRRLGITDYPTLVPNFDNTPRSGRRGRVLHGSTPDLFRRHVRETLEFVRDIPREHNLVFIKSWNEWAEGNHLEPDLKFGLKYLQVLRDECIKGQIASGDPSTEPPK